MFLVRSGAIEGYERLVRELGGDPVSLLAGVGLSHAQLRDPNTYVSYPLVAQLLEESARACGEPLLGLLLTDRQTSTVLGDLATSLAEHSTVGVALEAAEKYLYLHARGAHILQRERGDEIELELRIDIGEPTRIDQLMQMSVGQLSNFITELLGLDSTALPLHLRQQAPVQRPPALPRKVLFEAPFDGVRVPAQWMSRKPRRDEEALRQHFQAQLRYLQQRYPGNLTDQVKDVIGHMLPSAECRLERVAATLDMHPRVLQKRLKRESASYAGLLRETRMELAQQHLRNGSMSVTDLALHLGYAEVAVFSRQFRQWTGQSPRAWQADNA